MPTPSTTYRVLGVVLAAVWASQEVTQITGWTILRVNGPRLMKGRMLKDLEQVNHVTLEIHMLSVQICTQKACGQIWQMVLWQLMMKHHHDRSLYDQHSSIPETHRYSL